MSLISELSRRSVFRVGAAYLIVAWLLAQITDVAIPALRLPGWVTTFVIFLLLIGFPIALIFAWAYEVTPDGVKKTKDVPLEQSARRMSGRKTDFIVIGILVAGIGFLIADKYLLNPDGVLVEAIDETTPGASVTQEFPDEPKSIAVLPFVNMSDDPAQEYFADGISEEILNELSAIHNLRVISRTSSFALRGQNLSLSEIAARLGVDHVLEGSVRKAGNQIRITAQLIDASTDSHLWSETYNRELTVGNLLKIQESVAVAVANALQAKIFPQEYDLLRAEGPANLAALDLYHDGMYFVRKLEIGDFDAGTIFAAAIEKFEASIREDPDWAPSHAALGVIYHFWIGFGDREEKLRISKEHIMEALRLDDQYAPAHGSLAYILLNELDFAGAQREHLRLRSMGASTSWGYALLLMALAQYDAAIVEYGKAIIEDPLSMPVKAQQGRAYICAERYPEAIDALEALRAANPGIIGPNVLLSYAYSKIGDMTKGVQLAEEFASETGNDAPVAIVFALAGMVERAQAALAGTDMSQLRNPGAIAALAIVLGDEERALTILERAAAEAPHSLQIVRCFAEVRSLAGNPRYEAVLDKVGFPD